MHSAVSFNLDAADLLREYIARHNHGVRTGNFSALVTLFQPHAVVEFVGVAFAPLRGRDAIARGFSEHPPDDELVLTEPVQVPETSIAEAAYGWVRRRADPGGLLRLQAAANAFAIDRLTIRGSTDKHD